MPPLIDSPTFVAYLLVGKTKLMTDSRKLASEMTWTVKIENTSGATKKNVLFSWEDRSASTYASEDKWELAATLDGGTPVNMLGQSSFTADITQGTHTLIVHVTTNANPQNHAPTASVLSSGLVAQEGGAFSCLISASDADGDILQFKNFKLDGAAIAGSVESLGNNQYRFTSTEPLSYTFVAHPETSRSVVFRADVTDGEALTAFSGNVAVKDANLAPEGTGKVTVSPASPKTTQAVTAKASGMTDPDGDTITYEYTWSTDGAKVIAATLPADMTSKGQIWTLETVAKDAFGGEVSLGERTVTIANSKPTIEPMTIFLQPDEDGNATADLDLTTLASDPDGEEDIASLAIDGTTSYELPAGGTLSLVAQAETGKYLIVMASEGGVQEFPEGINFTAKVTDASGASATAVVTVISQVNSTPWYPLFRLDGVEGGCEAFLTSSLGEELTLFVSGDGIYPKDYYAAGFAGFQPGAVVDLAVYAYDAESGEIGALLLTARKTVEEYGLPAKPTLTVTAGDDANSFQFAVDAPLASNFTIELRDRATDEVVLRQRRAFAPGAEGMIPTQEDFLFQVASPGDFTVVVMGENPKGLGNATDGQELDCTAATQQSLAWPADATFDNGGSILVSDAFAMHFATLFSWTPVPGADSYELMLSCKELLMDYSVTLEDGATFTSENLRLAKGEVTTYTWRVVAFRGEEYVLGPEMTFRIVRSQPTRLVEGVKREGNALTIVFAEAGEMPVSAEILLFDEDALTSRWSFYAGEAALAVNAEGEEWKTGIKLRADHSYQVKIRLIQANGDVFCFEVPRQPASTEQGPVDLRIG